MRLKLLMLFLSFMSLCSGCSILCPKCPPPTVISGIPDDSVIVKKATLQRLMGDAIDCKRELIDCLEGKKSK